MSRAWVKNIIYEQACERQGLIQKQKSKLSRDLFMSLVIKLIWVWQVNSYPSKILMNYKLRPLI